MQRLFFAQGCEPARVRIAKAIRVESGQVEAVNQRGRSWPMTLSGGTWPAGP